jgi:acyl-CoA synthetase (AMP-forming)/AMP-acid ligase II/thioesterase domain-containing protein/acyl carrier protein
MLRLIANRAADNPTAFALLAPGRRSPMTYEQLYTEIQGHARVLRAIGVGKEDRVALLLPNGPEAALGFLATSTISACAPLNPICGTNEIDAVLSNLKPKVLIASPNLDPERRAVAEKHGVLVVTATPDLKREAGTFTLSVSAPVSDTDDILPQPHDLALLLHTSGTTSQPKLVGLTHDQLRRSAENIVKSLQLGPDDRCLNVMPLFHIHGIVAAILSTLCAGASVVCSPGFQGRQFFQWLPEFQPSWFTAVPTMHAAIVANAAQRGFDGEHHSLRFIRSCSAPLPRGLLREVERWFGVPVVEAYGMTEAAHQIASNPLPPGVRKPGSVGVSTGTEIAIFDELGQPVGSDCEGEIVIRGRNVISHYLGNSCANRECFKHGWFYTGDRGLIDRDGYLFLKGRGSEFINRGGTKISPHEIEEALLDHPNIAEAVAFAIPESRLGEAVAAAVVLRNPMAASEAEIREFASRKLSYFKVPQQLVFLDKIPKGPTGKLQRVRLASELGLTAPPKAPLQGAPMHEARTQLEDVLATIIAQIIGIEKVDLNDNFFEVGGDSLAALELIAGIEQVTGKRLTIAALFPAPTVKRLAALIEQYDPGTQPYVVPVQGSGSKPPFFCVDAGPRYIRLAQLLNADRPFLGLIYPDVIATSVEAIAEFCVKSIRAVQREGPYFVSGWCGAGLIAYEIAQQLREQDQEVALLVLFDSVNPARLEELSTLGIVLVQADELFRKIWFHLRWMIQLEPARVPDYFIQRLKRIWHTLTRRTGPARAATNFFRPIFSIQPPNLYAVGRRYRPKSYDGRVILFRRSLRAVSKYLDWKLGWASVITGDFNVVEIPGGHEDMLGPQVQCTAVKLTAYLRDPPERGRRRALNEIEGLPTPNSPRANNFLRTD